MFQRLSEPFKLIQRYSAERAAADERAKASDIRKVGPARVFASLVKPQLNEALFVPCLGWWRHLGGDIHAPEAVSDHRASRFGGDGEHGLIPLSSLRPLGALAD